jgi:sec-independent protein translocase protein TatA
MPEMMVILVIALIIFGPKMLPDLGSSIGKAIRGFKKSIEEPEKENENISTVNKIEDQKL